MFTANHKTAFQDLLDLKCRISESLDAGHKIASHAKKTPLDQHVKRSSVCMYCDDSIKIVATYSA